jgi:hypothetical protein
MGKAKHPLAVLVARKTPDLIRSTDGQLSYPSINLCQVLFNQLRERKRQGKG